MFKFRALLLAAAALVSIAAPASALHQPDPPTVTVETVQGAINLTWSEVPSTDFPIVRYRLSRVPAFNDGSDHFTSSSSRSYIDTEVVNGTRYTYDVRAIDLSGKEGLPGSGSATAGVPLAPQDFVVTTGAKGKATLVDLSWAFAPANGASVTEYRIYRGPAMEPIGKVRGERLSFSDVIHDACFDHFYYVTAVNIWGEGAPSERITVSRTGCTWD